ncbi:hypothetical protein ACTFIW_003808 [Dictyostelium discoideum]
MLGPDVTTLDENFLFFECSRTSYIFDSNTYILSKLYSTKDERFVLDYRELNNQTIEFSYPMPDAESDSYKDCWFPPIEFLSWEQHHLQFLSLALILWFISLFCKFRQRLCNSNNSRLVVSFFKISNIGTIENLLSKIFQVILEDIYEYTMKPLTIGNHHHQIFLSTFTGNRPARSDISGCLGHTSSNVIEYFKIPVYCEKLFEELTKSSNSTNNNDSNKSDEPSTNKEIVNESKLGEDYSTFQSPVSSYTRFRNFCTLNSLNPANIT